MSDLIDNAQNVRRWLDEKGQHEKGQHEKADAVSALVIAYQTLKNAKPAEQQEATCKQSLQVAAATKAGGDEPVATDKRMKVKLGGAYGHELVGHWFYLHPADEFAEKALEQRTGIAATRPQPQAELNSWSVLAARALDDAHRVLETIEPETSSEADSISELSNRVQELFVQALVLHGFKTRKEMDAAKHFNRVAINTAMLSTTRPQPQGEKE